MFLPRVLSLLFTAPMHRVPLFFVRATLLMTTITLPAFLPVAHAIVYRVIHFGMLLTKVNQFQVTLTLIV
jgi:hypothetical protein